MIFQEPMASLGPIHSIGDQITETILLHQDLSKSAAREKTIAILRRVGIPDAERRLDAYPFQLSGGMRQRAMIALALCCEPRLLIADEPTTALDVTTQANILDLLRELQPEYGMAVMFITHDLGVVAEIADDVVVMYLGRVVEQAPVDAIFHAPKHPYTQALAPLGAEAWLARRIPAPRLDPRSGSPSVRPPDRMRLRPSLRPRDPWPLRPRRPRW